MRPLLAALALLAATPSAAQDTPEWAGVWEGRIGSYSVRACFDGFGDGPGRGSYYYLSQLEPISLSEEEGEITWIERAATGDAEAFWQPSEMTATRVRGIWMQGSRQLPIDLRPVRWTDGEWGGPCGSAAFLAPRVRPAQFASEDASLEGWTYTRRIFRPPAHFRDEVSIESFSFASGQTGDAAINAALAAHLPRGTVEDDFLQCLAGGISSLGTDGYYERTVRPMLVSAAFLAVDEANSDFCGGAHPNHWQVMRVFDRRTGTEIDLFDWLGEPYVEGETSPIAEGLRGLIIARWPRDADAECAVYAEEADYWSLGLARGGIVFQPDLPHAATPCEERITVEWQALAPFLDADGRAGLARLRGG
jgi:hypothetical protein